jgi:hypothetical protein
MKFYYITFSMMSQSEIVETNEAKTPKKLKNKKPARCHLLFYCTSYRLNMSLQPGHHSSLTVPNLQHTANEERYDQCGNQHHSCKLLMMDIVMLKTC